MKEVKKKHPGGRPCEYCKDREKINRIANEYVQAGIDGKIDYVFLTELAFKLDHQADTLTDWSNNESEHLEFSRIIKKLFKLQEMQFQRRVLGKDNPTGAIFLLKTKHGYIETEKTLLQTSGDSKMTIEFIEERKLPEDE